MTSGGGAAAFSPLDISGLKLWLDASQIVGLNDGDAVGTWSDASGNGYDAAQSTVSRRPLYKTSVLNGKPTVRYDGVDDYLFNATFAQAQPATWFCVAKPTSLAGGSKFVLDSYDGTSRYTLDFEPTTSKWRCYAGNFLSESGTSGLDFKSLVVHYNGASSKITVGGVETSGHAGADGLAGGYVLGCAVSAIGFYFVGDIAEIGCYSRTLTAQELTDLAGYIASKYGL